MTVTVFPGEFRGQMEAVSSKSQAHRELICAALSRAPTRLFCEDTSQDIDATVRCLVTLGAEIQYENSYFSITPMGQIVSKRFKPYILDCGESGSTLRFLLPIVCAMGVNAAFKMSKRLSERPLGPLEGALSARGVNLKRTRDGMLRCGGKLQAGEFSLPGDVSSQYASGLLLALPLLQGDSHLTLVGTVESADYIQMTRGTAFHFGVSSNITADGYNIPGRQRYRSPGEAEVEGDWSNAAFWLCAGAMPGGVVYCSGLREDSTQGDRAVLAYLEEGGAILRRLDDACVVCEGKRYGFDVDATNIPDLVPILSALGAVSEGTTIIRNASRLRLKESDRLHAITETLNALGGQVVEVEDGLMIHGVSRLKGGEVDSFGDHRIAMMAAIASAACTDAVVIHGAEAVRKSYPHFWRDLRRLGKKMREEESDE